MTKNINILIKNLNAEIYNNDRFPKKNNNKNIL